MFDSNTVCISHRLEGKIEAGFLMKTDEGLGVVCLVQPPCGLFVYHQVALYHVVCLFNPRLC